MSRVLTLFTADLAGDPVRLVEANNPAPPLVFKTSGCNPLDKEFTIPRRRQPRRLCLAFVEAEGPPSGKLARYCRLSATGHIEFIDDDESAETSGLLSYDPVLGSRGELALITSPSGAAAPGGLFKVYVIDHSGLRAKQDLPDTAGFATATATGGWRSLPSAATGRC